MTEARARSDIASEAARWVARRDAGLSAAERKEFNRWLAEDPSHPAALDHYAKAWRVLDRPQRMGAADSVLFEMAAQTRRRRRRTAAMASALAVLLVAGYLWRTHPAFNTSGTTRSNAIVLLPEKRVLSDGSEVELKPGARIAVDFSGSFRRVALQAGEAHFQVAKDKVHPFVVSAGGIEVRAVGTAFSVDLGSKEVDILVTEGRVAVGKGGGAALAGSARPGLDSNAAPQSGATSAAPLSAPTFVDAGHRLVVPVQSNGATGRAIATAVTPDELAERLSWRAPRLEFSDTPLGAAVDLMNRSSVPRPGSPRVRLVIDPDSRDLAREPVTGLFRADSSEGFVRVLELSLGVKAERSGDTIVLHRP